MVCDREWLVSTAQSVFFMGGVLGCIVLGWIADKWGRRPSLLFFAGAMATGSLAAISPPNYTAYIAARLVVGLSYPTVFGSAFLISTFS